MQNHGPVSLLSICGKSFERVIFNPIFEFLYKNGFLCSNQSGFCLFNSCENQLLSNFHEVYANYDQHPILEVRANFLDISKACNRVSHEGLLLKYDRIRISGNLPSLHRSFLSNRFQRVVLNGHCYTWSSVFAGFPQGPILGPLLFLIYIKDLLGNLQSTAKLFVDEKSLFSSLYDRSISASELNSNLKKKFTLGLQMENDIQS